MPGRTPSEAYFEFIDPIQRALNFITVGRLALSRSPGTLQIGTPENVVLNAGDPAPLRTLVGRQFRLDVSCRISIARIDSGKDPFECQMIAYRYAVLDQDIREVIAFHWAPNATDSSRAYPHLHVGAVVSGNGSVIPDRFHKLHLPTGPIFLEDVVRFAIEELGVEVRSALDRNSVLAELAKEEARQDRKRIAH